MTDTNTWNQISNVHEFVTNFVAQRFRCSLQLRIHERNVISFVIFEVFVRLHRINVYWVAGSRLFVAVHIEASAEAIQIIKSCIRFYCNNNSLYIAMPSNYMDRLMRSFGDWSRFSNGNTRVYVYFSLDAEVTSQWFLFSKVELQFLTSYI